MNSTERLINIFFTTHRSLHKHLQRSGVHANLSPLQYMTLKFVAERRGASMKEIAQFVSVTPASATSLVQGLVKAGTLQRIPDRADRRIVRIRATAAGRRRMARTEQQARRELGMLFSRLHEKDRRQFADMYEKLQQILHASNLHPKTHQTGK